MKAVCLTVKGIVQGVGFRPFVRQLALQLDIPGSVRNTADGVCIVLPEDAVAVFRQRLIAEQPRLARIDEIVAALTEEELATPFEIRKSLTGDVQTGIAPDAATCNECTAELNDPADRRHHYPFLNCTNCGPRFSIVHAIPYDRANTSMQAFSLCADCRSEYNDQSDRRYHAQPLACPACGPTLWFEDSQHGCYQDDALQQAIALIQSGGLLAVRGIGGYHIACAACDEAAVRRLRERKNRPTKPFAVMARDIEVAGRYIRVDSEIEALLSSPVAPIVLVAHRDTASVAPSVLCGLGKLGIMLPYSPLHKLLLAAFDTPLVMTSGNCGGAPQITDNDEARSELNGIVDGWLMHNRPIENRIDDSVVQFTRKGSQVLRRARGLVPEHVDLPQGFAGHPEAIAFGADSKNAFALAKGGRAIMSRHIGDLTDYATATDLQKHIERLTGLFDVQPKLVICDLHQSYQSSRLAQAYAEANGLPLVHVQHHHAHAASLMVERQLDRGAEIIALVQDGMGLGADGDIWGAEMIRVGYRTASRLATLCPAAMQGGDAAARQPWRNLIARLLQHFGPLPSWPQRYQSMLSDYPVQAVCAAIAGGINAPVASSSGRLFEAVAMALGYAPAEQSFEGEAAMLLEQAASDYIHRQGTPEPFVFGIQQGAVDTALVQLDIGSVWDELLPELAAGDTGRAAARFHLGWADAWAQLALQYTGETPIALTGGSFQNQLISNRVADTLEAAGKTVLLHATVPPNDAGIALGQLGVGLAIAED